MTRMLRVSLPDDDHHWLKVEAAREGVTLTEYIRRLVSDRRRVAVSAVIASAPAPTAGGGLDFGSLVDQASPVSAT